MLMECNAIYRDLIGFHGIYWDLIGFNEISLESSWDLFIWDPMGFNELDQ